jgi:oxygen-independent coproporphyrinogen-3 oxidase
MSSEPIPTSVYVHFPWCARKCPYCDFATEPIRTQELPHDAYADAVLRELDARAADLRGRELKSIFFGGGTPSLWRPDALGRALEAITNGFDQVHGELEVTVECNPSSLTHDNVALLRDAGVDRLSIGVQSLRDPHLRFLGRLHDSKRAVAALKEATSEMPRVSVDLMFGMPGQTLEELGDDIARIVDAGVRHVSAYALTIEEKTMFGSLHRAGKLRVAPEEQYAELFEHAERCFADLGWRHYEVSNYAAEGTTRSRTTPLRGRSLDTIFTIGEAAHMWGLAQRRSAASIRGPDARNDGGTTPILSGTSRRALSERRSKSWALKRSCARR